MTERKPEVKEWFAGLDSKERLATLNELEFLHHELLLRETEAVNAT